MKSRCPETGRACAGLWRIEPEEKAVEALYGAARIEAVFQAARGEGRCLLIPYLTLGYPTPRASLALVRAVTEAGADIVELGIPFSDPLADGPTIQRATHVALEQGMTVTRCLESAAALRCGGVQVPFLFMTYYNPILAYGEAPFCRACRESGVDGLIVPDLPLEEAASLQEACEREGLALVFLLAPTSTDERIRKVAGRSRGFIYLVSVTGVTGAREHLPPDLAAFVQRVRRQTDQPLCVGFGISLPEQVQEVARVADGVIVGSAILERAAKEDGIEQVGSFVSTLRRALDPRLTRGSL